MKDLGAALLLVALVALAYVPAYSAGFIWDDDDYVTENPTLRTGEGLRRIWFELGAVAQYYPLTYTTFWIEYQAWALDPVGYHVVNVLLHALNGVLLWLLLRRLKLPAAWLAAAVFVLHPLCVESVAWVTERKNVLSGAMFLLTLLAWFRAFPERPEGRRVRWYVLSLTFFALALLSKTATVTLPVVLLILMGWKHRLSLRVLFASLPLFLMSLASGLVTIYAESTVVGAVGDDWSLGLVGRTIVAGQALWFYLGKVLWPHPLVLIYARWNVDESNLLLLFYPLAVGVLLVALWLRRRHIGRGPLVAALYFCVTVGPALGFINIYLMRFSWVADHFVYLTIIAPIVLVVCGVARWSVWSTEKGRRAAIAVSAGLLMTLAALSFSQARIYENHETLWRATLRHNPEARIAHTNLGGALLRRSQGEADPEARRALLDEARGHLERAAGPDYPEALSNLGILLDFVGEPAAAVDRYRQALRVRPGFADVHNNLGISLATLGRIDEATASFAEAVRLNPEMANARFNLGAALIRLGRSAEAMPHLEAALRLDPDNEEARRLLSSGGRR